MSSLFLYTPYSTIIYRCIIYTGVLIIQNSTLTGYKQFMEFVLFVGQEYTLNSFALSTLLPQESSPTYYRYHGSLTTPGCFQSVIWTVFETPIHISEEQVCYTKEMLCTCMLKEQNKIPCPTVVCVYQPDHDQTYSVFQPSCKII